MLISQLKNQLIEKGFFHIDEKTNEIDGLNGKVIIKKDYSIEEKMQVVDLCSIIGFYSTALDLPIVKVINNNSEINKNDICIEDFNIFNNISNINKSQNSKTVQNITCLSDIENIQKGILIDTDNDFLPDEINAQIVINNDCKIEELISACNVSTTLGLNSLGCSIPTITTIDALDTNTDKINIYIGTDLNNDKQYNGNIYINPENNSINICGNRNEIENISKVFCERYTNLINLDGTRLSDFIKGMNEAFNTNSKKEKVTIFNKQYNLLWEVDDVKNSLKNIANNIHKDDTVDIKVVVSEEESVRKELKSYIENMILEKEAKLGQCSILCSYKQGLSWIMEEVIPKIKSFKDEIEGISIKFKPFLPEGKTKWDDEDGSIPKVTASRDDNPNKFFDLPIRLVQELYPVDDLIEEEIGLNRDKVLFEILEDAKSDYKIEVYNSNNEVIYTDILNVYFSERPYLDEYENIGKVHPTTGYLEVKVNGEIALSRNIKTDVEKIWDIYQADILASCKDYILEKTNGEPSVKKQPFFDVLKLDIQTSEPDYKLNIREDRISVLSSLHEDLYFVGLDFFKTMGLNLVNESLDEPGLILPIINKRNGQGTTITATLESSSITENNELPVEFSIKGIDMGEHGVSNIYLEANGDQELFKYIEDNTNLIHNYIDSYGHSFNKIFITINNKELIIDIDNIKPNAPNKELNIKDIKIPQDRVIGYDEYIDIINQLKNVPGINVWKASKSYQGKDIYAIEVIKPYKSSIISRSKVINNRPVFQINNRHHANEVSSTNSAFLLLEQLLTNNKYREYLNKVNIVMIPFENVDGGDIHYELQKDNPEWQLHIARFNSVGKEFARDYFDEDSKYTESRALTNLWYRWLPDILTDNHGVPKHEWDQQFSGYTSPWFKGFWLPRALFYGYFWYLDDERYPENKQISEAIQDIVSDYINADEEISRWNKDWKDRFEKYAHQWMPKLFPANYYKELIYYWLPYKPNENAWHVSHRYPWITAVDWTTEVSDETAQGEYLQLCSRTHNLGDLAIIDLLSKATIRRNTEFYQEGNNITFKDIRIRPLQV